MAPDQDDALVAQLRALGRSLGPPVPPSDLAVTVLHRLAGADAPSPPADRDQRPGPARHLSDVLATPSRRIAVAALVVVLSLLGVPSVRAAVGDWFGFHGVQVRIEPSPDRSATPAPPPTAGRSMSLHDARALVNFRAVELTALGTPSGVEVSADHRVLSMSWDDRSGGAVRLDQFDGALDYTFAKTAPGVHWTTVDGASALWFERPHEVVVLDAAGNSRTETARLAGHTLIWESGGTVLRLEGDLTLEQALILAASAQPLP